MFDQVEKGIKDSLKFEGFKPKPVPNFEKSRADVKLNAAMLKREKHLIDKEEREQADIMQQMEMGLKDASEFYRWQREMEQKDDIEKIERIQKMKIEMELAREQAIIAKEKNVQENHDHAIKVKKEIDLLLTERDKQLAQIIIDNKETIKQVHHQHERTLVAKQEIIEEKKKIAEEVTKEIEDRQKRLRDEQAAEQAKKEELIRQLRELEKIPIQRYQGFDPTEAGNHGLMCEMSIAELRERIELNKAKLAQEIEFKRDTNLAKKERDA